MRGLVRVTHKGIKKEGGKWICGDQCVTEFTEVPIIFLL